MNYIFVKPFQSLQKRLAGFGLPFFPGENAPRLKILIIIPYSLHPPYTGGSSRIIQKIKYLGVRHDLTVACIYFRKNQQGKIRKLIGPYCRKIITEPALPPLRNTSADIPEKVRSVTTIKMYRRLEKIADRFDIVMHEHIFTALYGPIFKNSFTIIEEHNIESMLLAQKSQVEIDSSDETEQNQQQSSCSTNNLAAFENKYWPLFDLRTTVSQHDRTIMQSICNKNILVVENGVNPDEILPVKYNHHGDMLFMGTMKYWPNIEAAIYFTNKILPLVTTRLPDTRLIIAGNKPGKEVKSLENMQNVICIRNPPDISAVAGQCFVSVVPLKSGSGTRIKILMSLAMGIPVITTRSGCEGLYVNDGEHLLIRDDPDDFAKAIIQLRHDRELCDLLRIQGRLLVKKKYNILKIMEEYEQHLLAINMQSSNI